MMYPFITLDFETEIVHSKMLEEGRVKVYIKKDGFHHATCYIPGPEWIDV